MKLCTKCGTQKSITEFYVKDKKINRFHAQCKTCYKVHRQNYYAAHYEKYRTQYQNRAKEYRKKIKQKFRANMMQYLAGKQCLDCGESDIRVLELDHIDPQGKNFTVSQAVRLGKSWEETLEELKKCRVLCANCHKKRTAQQFNWYKAVSGGA